MPIIKVNVAIIGNMTISNQLVTPADYLSFTLSNNKSFHIVSASRSPIRLKRFFEMTRLIFKWNVKLDIVFLQFYSGVPSYLLQTFIVLYAKVFKCKLVFYLHGGDIPNFTIKYSRWTNMLFGQASCIMAPSNYLLDFSKSLGFECVLVPNMIDIQKYHFKHRETKEPLILWMRSFHDVYNPKLMIDALLILISKYPQIKLIMAGKDKGVENEVKNYVNSLGLDKYVDFPGFLDETSKLNYISKCNIFVSTSRKDNMPICIVEAFASGLPVVSSNVGGVPDLVNSGISGILFDDNDVKGLVDGIEKVITDADFRHSVVNYGLMIAKRSSLQAVSTQIESLLMTVHNH
jgi:glycosyltransferase involved in cell wall biosynthesis